MATKNYMINDKWLDINKKNIIELQSVDGVLDSVKLNGEEYGGGGGSSDFSTAEVTIINNTNNEMYIYVAILQADPDTSYGCVYLDVEEQAAVTVVLYKGKAFTNIPFYGNATSTTGNYNDGTITGNDTITINPAP